MHFVEKTGKLKMLQDVSLVKIPLLTALQAGIKWPMSFFGGTLPNNILSESAFYTELKVCKQKYCNQIIRRQLVWTNTVDKSEKYWLRRKGSDFL